MFTAKIQGVTITVTPKLVSFSANDFYHSYPIDNVQIEQVETGSYYHLEINDNIKILESRVKDDIEKAIKFVPDSIRKLHEPTILD